MSSKGIDLDELLDAREKLKRRDEGDRAAELAPNADELSLLALVGMWLMLTVMIVVRLITVLLLAIAKALEMVQEAQAAKPKPKPRKAASRR